MSNLQGFPVTPGSGSKIATHRINEGGEDREIQRTNPNTPEGEDASIGSAKLIDFTLTRPGNVTAYGVNDAMSNSTTAPTSGGFVFTDASRGAGKNGLITDLIVLGSGAQSPNLQGELWLFDSAVTNINDNDPFAVTITDLRKLVSKIGFTLAAAGGGPSVAHINGLNDCFHTVGSANLYGLIKVLSAYTPLNGEQITFRLKTVRTN